MCLALTHTCRHIEAGYMHLVRGMTFIINLGQLYLGGQIQPSGSNKEDAEAAHMLASSRESLIDPCLKVTSVVANVRLRPD